MTSAFWFLLVGGLLLAMGLTSPILRRLPITPAVVYLAVGILIGPTMFDAFRFRPIEQAALLEVLTEAAVLISLFSTGIKMPVPFSLARWRTPIVLASASLAITVGLVAAFAHFVLGLPLGAGVLLGAIVAPTDPVLATDVQIRHPGDRDQLRVTLTCEAGMNDGSAFPFVMLGMGLLGLHELGEFGLRWVLVDVVWATVAGIAIGVVSGAALARFAWKLRGRSTRDDFIYDFLGLGLIGAVYGLSTLVNAWGFLAVFFAAVALRQTEVNLVDASQGCPPGRRTAPPTISKESLVFKEHLERLSEVVLILLIGGTLFQSSWSWQVVGLALFLFTVARPIGVFVGMLGGRTSWRMRAMTGWFGIRGIGSLYYLMFAIQHGLPAPLALELIQLTLVVVTLSIVAHGISVRPLMNRFERYRGRPAS